MDFANQPFEHRSHDYPWLLRRWRKVAQIAAARWVPYYDDGEFAHYFLQSKPSGLPRPSVYLSAGIHGDEPAATEGLLTWASRAGRELREFDLMIFPCLNPWGLVNNRRSNSDGVDLNRTYHDDRVPATRAHKALLTGRRFDLALTLHEDYDAHGIYLYEVQKRRPFWGEALIAAAKSVIPVDSRKTIEGSRARGGLVRRRIGPDFMTEHPEAFALHFHNARRTFTIETPSEHHLPVRIEAQVAVIEEAMRLCRAEFRDGTC